MSNHWIVSDHNFFEHSLYDAAEKEHKRLSEKFPGRTFRIYRIKGTMAPSQAPLIIRDLCQKINDLLMILPEQLKESTIASNARISVDEARHS